MRKTETKEAYIERKNREKEFKRLSKKEIQIEPFFSSDYDVPVNMDLYTVSFNNPKIIEYQIRLIKKNIIGNYRYIVCDNSNKEYEANLIKEVCKKYDITYIRVSINTPSGMSDSHGRALNWVYNNVIKKRQNNFGFLDHDIFPIKEIEIEKYLSDSDIKGVVQNRNKIWYLWPGLSFYKYDYVKDKKLNFRRYRLFNIFKYKNVDTGSGNWIPLYKNYPVNGVDIPRYSYINIVNKEDTDWSKVCGDNSYIQKNISEIFDGNRWFHSLCGSNWIDTDGKDKIVYKMLEDYCSNKD